MSADAGRAGIRLRRAWDPPEPDDGYRVLVDRLWPRGLRKESLALDRGLKEVAPSTSLRRWFGHDPARWEEFRRRYRAELEDGDGEALAFLREKAAEGTLTLVFAARDREHNQAVVLRSLLLEDGSGRS